jgi:hypothetical protein
MAVVALLASLIFSPPQPVSRLLYGRLAGVCQRESRCRPVGIHEQDAWAGRRAYRKAVARGWLDPAGCIFHHGSPERFSTRGGTGQIAAYALRFIDGCWPPEILDIPAVDALAARRRAASEACDAHPRCRSWRGS